MYLAYKMVNLRPERKTFHIHDQKFNCKILYIEKSEIV